MKNATKEAKIADPVSEFLGLSKARARAILHEMATDDVIDKVGTNRYAYYVLKNNLGEYTHE
jgi:hypothetical protein